MNRISIIGNLTRDPEYATTNNGNPVCKFTVAVKRRYTDETDFIPVVTWRGLADNCHKYLFKGSKVMVSGEIHLDRGEDNEGRKFTAVSISADEVEFVGTPKGQAQAETPAKPAQRAEQTRMTEVPNPEDLPF